MTHRIYVSRIHVGSPRITVLSGPVEARLTFASLPHHCEDATHRQVRARDHQFNDEIFSFVIPRASQDPECLDNWINQLKFVHELLPANKYGMVQVGYGESYSLGIRTGTLNHTVFIFDISETFGEQYALMVCDDSYGRRAMRGVPNVVNLSDAKIHHVEYDTEKMTVMVWNQDEHSHNQKSIYFKPGVFTPSLITRILVEGEGACGFEVTPDMIDLDHPGNELVVVQKNQFFWFETAQGEFAFTTQRDALARCLCVIDDITHLRELASLLTNACVGIQKDLDTREPRTNMNHNVLRHLFEGMRHLD